MKCKICNETQRIEEITLSEKMFGLGDEFSYLKCNNCGCIQIAEIPANIADYYPDNYVSFEGEEGIPKLSSFKKLQSDYLISNKNKIFGSLATIKYKAPMHYDWLRNLGLTHHNATDSLLDIGCGTGYHLKQIYSLGFHNLNGVDPFIKNDMHITEGLTIVKKSIFELEKTYDFIMMNHSLEHMDEQQKVIKRIHDLLKIGGRAMIRIPIFSQPLWDQYKENVVSLDAPRHFFVHSIKSITQLLVDAGFNIYKTVYDAVPFSHIASDQYVRGIALENDDRCYWRHPENSPYTKQEIKRFKHLVNELNRNNQSDNVAIYIEK